MDRRRVRRRIGAALAGAVVAVVLASGAVAAHAAGLRSTGGADFEVPTWLFLTTGGGAVGASFLLASFVTDRVFIRSIDQWGRRLPSPGRIVSLIGRLTGVSLLLLTVYVGYVGPSTGIRNFAVVFVWAAWWGGYVASTYLVGNTWPTLNPFRTLADLMPTLEREYPDRLGAWPSVVGLLALIWIEVVTPLADDPRLLASMLVGYTGVSLVGSAVFGSETWFGTVDPISRAFSYFGRVAPLERTDDGIELRLPGMGLTDPGLASGRDEVAFIVCLLYVTTFDGFVATWLWADIVVGVVGLGLPPLLVYLVAYVAGFGCFLGGFWWSMGAARRYGSTYISREALGRRFAPSLLAIAVGYHLAHNLVFVLGLLPTVVVVAAAPLSPPQQPPVLAGIPGWLSGVEMGLVLLGHVIAVWVAHAAAYDLFPGRLEAVKSQYGITVVMVCYTMISLWIVTTSPVEPPFISGGGP